jgi:MSHA pilin protein MshA
MKNMKNSINVKANQEGFTLIELVVVIVILGILAVTAAPKFIDLQDDAKTATLNAIKASMQTAATLVHGKSLIESNNAKGQDTVKVNGTTVGVAYGYPISINDTAGATGTGIPGVTAADTWAALLDVPDFDILIDSVSNTVVVAPKDLYVDGAAALAAGNVCTATYTEATGITDATRATYVVAGC